MEKICENCDLCNKVHTKDGIYRFCFEMGQILNFDVITCDHYSNFKEFIKKNKNA
jgi:hypothetical protein